MDMEKVAKGLKCLITDDVPCNGCPYNGSGYCIKNIASDALELLKEQPQVVRCKDCKRWDSQCHSCEHFDGIMQPDFYCADGERKD